MAGKPWYNNGVVEIQRGYNEEIPDGFIKGRLPKSNEARIKLSKSLNSRTEEQKKESNLKRSESLKAIYRNMSEEKKAALREKRRIIYYSRTEEQMLEYRKKLSASLIGKNKGRPGWRKGLTKDTDERIKSSAEKLGETLKQQAAQKPKEYFYIWRKNIRQRMHENGTEKSSKPEDDYYMYLCSVYGEDDVIRHYSDERYPYDCDFYIKSEDLFIEFNGHPSHGPHQFDKNNEDDLILLEQLKTKNTRWSNMIIDTWTRRDVCKLETAKRNNLSYKTVYKTK